MRGAAKRPWRDVRAVKSGDDEWFITGGHLKPDEAWVPTVVDVDGDVFLPLGKKSRLLPTLCGTDLSCNAFLEELHTLRNKACNQVLCDLRSKRDPLAEVNRAACAASSLARSVKRDLASDAPKSISVSMPVPGSGGVAFQELTLAFESDDKVTPSLLLTSHSLNFVAKGVRDSLDSGRGRKRSLGDRIVFDWPECHWNYSRGSGYVAYKDMDGRLHTKHMKMTEMDDKDAALQDLGQRLHEFYCENHHGPALSPEEESLRE